MSYYRWVMNMLRFCAVLVACLIVLPSGLVAGGCGDGSADRAPETDSAREGVVESIEGWEPERLDIYFVPGGVGLEDRIAEEVTAAETEIRVAMYNLRSERLGYALLERQQAGVAVEVLWDAKQMEQDYNTLDDELIAAGLNVVPVLNERHEYATLHHKVAILDGTTVITGSANWSVSGLEYNEETVLEATSPVLAAEYDRELDEVLSGWKDPRPGDISSRAQLYFSPEDSLDDVIRAQIDAAQDHIYAAVFSFRLSGLADALVDAHQRGIEVYLITDEKQSVTTSVDEILKDAGVPVVEALNATTPYTAMHHKFMVVDGHTTVVGSYNWTFTATVSNYEDLAVIAGDTEVAAAFEGEFGRLWDRYGDGDNPIVTTATVDVAAHCDATAWGDTLVLVGDQPELGSWDPHSGVQLSGEQWPTWTGQLELRAGAAFEYKLVLLEADGSVRWEAGANHCAVVPTDPCEILEIDDAFRH